MPDIVTTSSTDDEKSQYGQQSTEALKVLESLNIQVELDYLRPPTWESLQEILSAKQDYYHLIHFDSVSLTAAGDDSSPHLVLEDSARAPAHIPVTQIAQSFKNANVPIVLLSGGIESIVDLNLWSMSGQIFSQAGLGLYIKLFAFQQPF